MEWHRLLYDGDFAPGPSSKRCGGGGRGLIWPEVFSPECAGFAWTRAKTQTAPASTGRRFFVDVAILIQMAMGQNPAPPVNIPIPTKID